MDVDAGITHQFAWIATAERLGCRGEHLRRFRCVRREGEHVGMLVALSRTQDREGHGSSSSRGGEQGHGEHVSRATGAEVTRDEGRMHRCGPFAPADGADAAVREEVCCRILCEREPGGASAMQQVGIFKPGNQCIDRLDTDGFVVARRELWQPPATPVGRGGTRRGNPAAASPRAPAAP